MNFTRTVRSMSHLAAMAALLILPARCGDFATVTPSRRKAADMSKPVQVYILMGQSNMLGFGKINPSKGVTRFFRHDWMAKASHLAPRNNDGQDA